MHEEKGKAARKVLSESEYDELLRLREKYSKDNSNSGNLQQELTQATRVCTPKSEKSQVTVKDREEKKTEGASAESVRRAKTGATVSQESISTSRVCTPKLKKIDSLRKLTKQHVSTNLWR